MSITPKQRSKLCLECIVIKPVKKFVKHRTGTGGVGSMCKACKRMEKRQLRGPRGVEQWWRPA